MSCPVSRCLLALSGLLVFVLAWPAARLSAQETHEKDAVANIRVRDFLQRELVFQQPVKRVVALAPHIVENLYSAGAGDYVVGAVDYCDFPPPAKNIPRVGAISAYSLEAIVALRPDVVIVWHSGRGGEVLAQLDKLGIPAYADNPLHLEDVAKSLRDFSRLAGTDVIGEQAARDFERTLDELRKEYQHRERVRTLYQVWHEPMQTLNGEHIISDVIDLCGGTNVFADALAVAPKISVESVLARKPEAIVASGMGEARPDWLDAWRRWQAIPAVANEQLFFVPPDIIQRHTVRILQGAALLCRHLQSARVQRDHATEGSVPENTARLKKSIN